MTSIHVNAVVRLIKDVPDLQLHCGDEGIVVSVWLSHGDFNFEVEFHRFGSPAVRTILRTEQLEVVGLQPKMAEKELH